MFRERKKREYTMLKVERKKNTKNQDYRYAGTRYVSIKLGLRTGPRQLSWIVPSMFTRWILLVGLIVPSTWWIRLHIATAFALLLKFQDGYVIFTQLEVSYITTVLNLWHPRISCFFVFGFYKFNLSLWLANIQFFFFWVTIFKFSKVWNLKMLMAEE